MMSNDYYVYMLMNSDTNKPFYIGKGKNDRWCVHFREKDNNLLKHNIIEKLKRENTKIHVVKVHDNISEMDAFEKEEKLIKLFGRRDLGTGILSNLTSGGDGVRECLYTEEQRVKNSDRNSGILNPMYGKKHTKDAIRKMKEKQSKRTYVYNHTEEWKDKLKVDNPGGKATSKPIAQYDIHGNLIAKWPSANAAAKKLGLSKGNIRACCVGKWKQYKGFVWKDL